MKSLIILLLVIVFSYGIGQWLNSENDRKSLNVSEKTYVCNLLRKICKIDNNITLQFQGAVSALTPFLVLVEIGSLQPESIKLTFSMEGMEMGFNKFKLTKNINTWQVRAILPVCSLGRNDWMLNMEMKFADVTKISKFKFSQSGE